MYTVGGGTYTVGGGGYSHATVSKFQYMPGGQGGGGGGWAPPTAGEASSISGRNANTTADTALRCSQGFIGHLSRRPLRGDSKIRALSGGSNQRRRWRPWSRRCRTFGVQDLHAGSGVRRFAATCRTGRVNRVATVEWDGRVGGVGWADAVAMGSAEAEHGDADAVVVAAILVGVAVAILPPPTGSSLPDAAPRPVRLTRCCRPRICWPRTGGADVGIFATRVAAIC